MISFAGAAGLEFVMLGTLCAVLACVLGLWMEPPAPGKPAPEKAAATSERFVGLWVTRWDYRTKADVQRIMDEAAALGVTDVMWQARGSADAYYRSDLEPWGEEILKGLPKGAKDPGFDPLEVAVIAAHAKGMKIHAWVNVMPLWKGKTQPANPKHPLLVHADWRLRDAAGVVEELNDHYVIANPVLPDVQDHIVKVCADIVTRYTVDGIHLDYIRFVSESMKDPTKYPGDARSIEMFVRATRRPGVVNAEDREALRGFVRAKITELVRRIKKEAVMKRPGVALTAAVWRRPDTAYREYLQDAVQWLREGTLDRAMPMVYTEKNDQFSSDIAAWRKETPGRVVTPGIGVYKNAPGQTGQQATIAGLKDGICLFDYGSLFESANPEQSKVEKDVAERAARLKELKKYLDAARGVEAKGPAPAPAAPSTTPAPKTPPSPAPAPKAPAPKGK